MSILVNRQSRIIVQGITGREGSFHTSQCIDYGTPVVGGVTPGKGGNRHLGLPVFDTVESAVRNLGADVALIFVPPHSAPDAIMESAEAGIRLIVCITEGIPVQDMLLTKKYVQKTGAMLIGPNCPGVITPGEAKVGIMPGSAFKRGTIGLISKSGTLTYEAAKQIASVGKGVSTAVGIGGDPIVGTTFIDLLDRFERDPETEAVMMIGEIGGDMEIRAGEYIRRFVRKPAAVFIAGRSAPKGKRMGHAGAIVSGAQCTAAEKAVALRGAGVEVIESPAEIGARIALLTGRK
jgi:succinyl-CoA synthetase alpha subunit